MENRNDTSGKAQSGGVTDPNEKGASSWFLYADVLSWSHAYSQAPPEKFGY
jgi:hypothetical protein